MSTMKSTNRLPRKSNDNVRPRLAAAELFVQQLSRFTGVARAPIITATGPINFVPGRIRFMPTEVGLLRLLELHRRATGSKGPFLLNTVGKLSPAAAKRAYGNALIAVLAQIAVIPQAGSSQILDRLCMFLENVGAMDGLESVWLTALLAAGASPVASTALRSFERLGPPRVLGSGVKYVPFIDPGTDRLCFASADTFVQLRKGVIRNSDGSLSAPSLNLVAGQSGPFANGPLAKPETLTDGISFSDWLGLCSDFIQVSAGTGATIGAFAGASAGPEGIPAGAGIGAVFGGSFGVGVCIGSGIVIGIDALSSKDSDNSSSSSSSSPVTDATAPGSQTQSSDDQSGSSSSSSDSSDDGDHKGDTVECGGTGPFGYPSPDDPGGNDGGAVIPHHIPSGAGLSGLSSLTSAGFFQFGAFPKLDTQGTVSSAGFMSV